MQQLTIRHSMPNASKSSFIFAFNGWDPDFPILLLMGSVGSGIFRKFEHMYAPASFRLWAILAVKYEDRNER